MRKLKCTDGTGPFYRNAAALWTTRDVQRILELRQTSGVDDFYFFFSWVSDSRHVELFDLESTLGVHQNVEGRSYLSLLYLFILELKAKRI